MQKKNFYNWVLSLFFLILFAVPVYWITRGPGGTQVSIIEARKLSNFPTLSGRVMKTAFKRLVQLRPSEASDLFFNQFADQTFQKEVDSAVSDQFPFRMTEINATKAINRGIIDISYALLPDPAIPADMHSGDYIMRDGSRLIFPPDNYNSSIAKTIDKRVNNYNALISEFPNLNFYLFYHQRIHNSPINPLNQYFPAADRGRALAYFEAHQPAGLTMSTMLLDSYDDFTKEYYATDHHWNVNGIGLAYTRIYDMLAKNYPGMSPRLDLSTIITFPNISFLGSIARETYYPIQGDKFQVFKLDMPAYKVYLGGSEFTTYNQKSAYLAGNYSTLPYLDHYEAYYGNQQDILDFDVENGATRNLLVIGSSFARPVVQMLAAHYHHTYYLDLRQTENFSLSKFLQDHTLNDVLILGDNTVAFTSNLWSIAP